VYEDCARFASFLTAPQTSSVDASASRVDAESADASIYVVGSMLSYKQLLVRLEFPYVSRISPSDIQSDFGDPHLRLRLRAWSSGNNAFHILSTLRMGSMPFLTPDENIYPYATASLDVGAGFAYVDTVASVTWWTSACAVHPMRLQDAIDSTGVYGDYTEATAGLAIAVTSELRIQAGVAGNFPSGASSRQIYFGAVDAVVTPAAAFYLSWQLEGGPSFDRVWNRSISLGMRMTF
jgi:hypothetical protein